MADLGLFNAWSAQGMGFFVCFCFCFFFQVLVAGREGGGKRDCSGRVSTWESIITTQTNGFIQLFILFFTYFIYVILFIYLFICLSQEQLAPDLPVYFYHSSIVQYNG